MPGVESGIMAHEGVFPDESRLFPDQEKKLSPEQVQELHPSQEPTVIESEDEYRASKSRVEQLLTPTARAVILDILVRYADDALTVTEVCEKTDRVSKVTFARHKEPLLDFGVIEQAGKKGNAQTYRANVYHPAVQPVAMLWSVLNFGQTRMLLDERFIKREFQTKAESEKGSDKGNDVA